MTQGNEITRRHFLSGTMAAGALWASRATGAEEAPLPGRKIKIGVIGLGGRGAWLAGLMRRHGGYELHAVADYFPAVAEKQGAALGVDASRRFSGLNGYRRVLESGVEAVVIIDVPYFYPEQAAAAADAGLHIYMAKPVAVDVPGCLSIRATATRTTQQKRVFLVDYQMPTEPLNQEVYRRIAGGALGKLQTIFSNGAAGGGSFNDPPRGPNLESRLQGLIWVNDDALGCGYIGNYDIHVVDAVMRALGGRMPVSATGWGDRFRASPQGDALDTNCMLFTFDDGLVWNHQSPKGTAEPWFSGNGSLAAEFQGSEASARISYWGKTYVRGGPQHYGGGKIENLYENGAVRNIAAFHTAVTQGDTSNPTVKPAVNSALVCILGREAAARRVPLTLATVLKEARKLEVDLTGLRA